MACFWYSLGNDSSFFSGTAVTWVLCSLPPYLFQLPLQPSELLEVSSCGRPVSRVWRALQNVVGFQPAFNCHLPDPRCAECCKINVLLASNVPSFMNPSRYVLPHAQHQLFLLPKLVAKRRWLIRSLQWGQGPESPGVLDLLLAQRVFSLSHSFSQSLDLLPHLLLHYQGHSPTSLIPRLNK